MKNSLNHTTRRSFIKKSTAAALAAVNVTVFSGLINAAEGGGGTGTGTGGTTGWFTTGSSGSGTTGWTTNVEICQLEAWSICERNTDDNGNIAWMCTRRCPQKGNVYHWKCENQNRKNPQLQGNPVPANCGDYA